MAVRFAAGLGYFAICAGMLTAMTDVGFGRMYLAVLGAGAACAALVLCWMTLWALRKDSRPGQFTIGSLFFLTALLAILLAGARWVSLHLDPRIQSAISATPARVALVAGVSLLPLVVAVPFLAWMSEAVIWFGVWLLRQPAVRERMGWRRKGGPE